MTLSRRTFVGVLAGAGACLGAEHNVVFPSEAKRFVDEATENVLMRLSDPAHNCWLPGLGSRAISRKGDFLICASDRAGSVAAYRLDLKNGTWREIAAASALIPESLTLTADEREFAYLADGALQMGKLGGGRSREVYRVADGFMFGPSLGLSEDGLFAALVEQKTGQNRVRLITLRTGEAVTPAESSDVLADPQPRPKRAGLLYRKGDELWLASYDRTENRRLRIAAGAVGNALWSADGRAVQYLNIPADPKQLRNIREFTPDANADQWVANTTQFASFDRNADGSVFIGASASKASPYLLLLLRAVRRELTLCKHGASDARQVRAFFSPNSQRVVFQSDRDGKMSLYSMAVDRLVADTDADKP